jgi:hypothetical protein
MMIITIMIEVADDQDEGDDAIIIEGDRWLW